MWKFGVLSRYRPHIQPVPDSGPQLAPREGLARNRQGSVQSRSLVWQKAQLGSSPLLSGGQEMWQLTLRDSLLGRAWRTEERAWSVGHSEGQKRESHGPLLPGVASPSQAGSGMDLWWLRRS